VGKKAIADSLSDGYGKQWMSEDGLPYPVEIFIHKDTVAVNVDTTGTGLHKRGYRTWNVEAPLKETIAAGLLGISYWNPGKVLLDPFCGSGTFPIEAAMDAMNIAPGMKRSFNIEDWGVSDMKSMRKEAASGIKEPENPIFACDISAKNIEIARKHAEKAGVLKYIDFRVSDFRNFEKPAQSGVIMANPPYGKRISNKNEIRDLYKGIGEMIDSFTAWSAYILTDEDNFEGIIRKKADKRRKIYNGTIRCTFYQYFASRR
jgi:putative N6-adenine-specific DNA methylase